MRDLYDRLLYALRRRPVRVAEALVAVAVAAGLVSEAVETDIVAAVGALLAVLAGEVAQRKATPLADPIDGLGRNLVPSEDPHAAGEYGDA